MQKRLQLSILFLVFLALAGLASANSNYTILDNGTNYTIFSYTTNGSFNPTANISNICFLAVAGGGGGGSTNGGGGGAGGLVYACNTTLPAGNYSIVIGQGGAADTTGQDTTFWNVTAKGGGGSAAPNGVGKNGGSGGGGGENTALSQPLAGGSATQPGSASGGYGNAGGNTTGVASSPTGGGGGSGTSGENGFGVAVSARGGNGGLGMNLTINGSTTCYAGGGGGGSGNAINGNGSCGGGNAYSAASGNLGGGGGSQSSGGPGVLILRYATSGSISSCQNISTTGQSYTLISNISSSGSCLNITGANTIIDCANYTIIGDNSTGGIGIWSNSSATQIKNCRIQNFSKAIDFVSGAINGSLTNNTITSTFNKSIGIQYDSGANTNSFNGNNLTVMVWVNDSGTGNTYNTSNTGNIYYFFNGSGSWTVFNISWGTLQNWADFGTARPFNSTNTPGNWSGSGADYFPYTENQVIASCQNLSLSNSQSIQVQNFTASALNCINITASNLTLDCQGFTITGTFGTAFNVSNSRNVTLKNCNLVGFTTGFYVKNGTGHSFINNTGISFASASPGTYGEANATIFAYLENINNSVFANSSVSQFYPGAAHSPVSDFTGGKNGANSTLFLLLNSSNNTFSNFSASKFKAGASAPGSGGTGAGNGGPGGQGGHIVVIGLTSSNFNNFSCLNLSFMNASIGADGGAQGTTGCQGLGGYGGNYFESFLTNSINNTFANITAWNMSGAAGGTNTGFCPAQLSGDGGSTYLAYNMNSSNNSYLGNIYFNQTNASSPPPDVGTAGNATGFFSDQTSGGNTFYLNNITGTVWVSDANGSNFYNSTYPGFLTMPATNSPPPTSWLIDKDQNCFIDKSEVDYAGKLWTAGNISIGNYAIVVGYLNKFYCHSAGNIYYFQNKTASWNVLNITNDGLSTWAYYGTKYPFNSSNANGTFLGKGVDYHPYTTSYYAWPLTTRINQYSPGTYNGTYINYTFCAQAINFNNVTIYNANITTLYNASIINVTVQNLAPWSFNEFCTNFEVLRPVGDRNITTLLSVNNTAAANYSFVNILPIDPADALILKGGGGRINVTLWNGSTWIPFNSTNLINVRCRIIGYNVSVWCNTTNQNNATGQPILNVTNNATASSPWRSAMTNTTFFPSQLHVGTNPNPALNANISPTNANYTTSNLSSGASEGVYVDIFSVNDTDPRDWNLTFGGG